MQYYLLFSNDVESLTGWMVNSFQGKILPIEIIKKMEWSDSIVLTEVGLHYLSLEDITRSRTILLLYLNFYQKSTLIQNNQIYLHTTVKAIKCDHFWT